MLANGSEVNNITIRSDSAYIVVTSVRGDEPVMEKMRLRHEDSLSTYEFAEESDGTQRLFDFIDLLLTNDRGAVFVVDEINRSLHPMPSKRLVVVTRALSPKSSTARGDSNTRRPVLLGSGNM